MAYVYDPNLSAEENERLRQQDEAGGGAAGQAGSSVIGAPGAGTGTSQVSGSGGSGFTNLQTYLQANQAQAGELADKIKGKIEERAGAAEEAVTGAAREGETLIGQGRINMDPALLDRAFASPESFVQNPTDLESFLRMRDASYTGPAGLEEAGLYEPARDKVQASSQDIERLGTEGGRLELVKQIMESPGAGKTALNQLLLQGTPEAAGKLTDLQGRIQDIAPSLEQVRAKAREDAEAARTATEETRSTTRTRLGEEIPKFKTGISERVGAAESGRQSRNEAIQQIMAELEQGSSFRTPGAFGGKTMNFTPEQFAQYFRGASPEDMQKAMDSYNAWERMYDLGMTNVEGSDFYMGPGSSDQPNPGFSLQPYVFTSSTQFHGTPASQSNVSTPEDFARARALEQLSGEDLGILPESEKSLAGTFNPQEGGVNFKQQEALAAYQGRVKNVVDNFFNIYNRMSDGAKSAYYQQALTYAAMMRQAGLPEPQVAQPGGGPPPHLGFV